MPRAWRPSPAVSPLPSCNNPRGGDCEPQTTVELGPSAQRLIISMNRTTRSAWQAGMTAACAIVLTVLAALVAVGCGSAVAGGGGAGPSRRPPGRLSSRFLAFPPSPTKALRRAAAYRSRCPRRPEEQAGTNTGCWAASYPLASRIPIMVLLGGPPSRALFLAFWRPEPPAPTR